MHKPKYIDPALTHRYKQNSPEHKQANHKYMNAYLYIWTSTRKDTYEDINRPKPIQI